MIDECASLCHKTQHNWNVVLILTKSVRKSLLVEFRKQAERASEEIGSCLDPAPGTPLDLQGAYTILKSWHHHVSTRAPKPLWTYMAKVMGDYGALYWREYPDPPGRTVSTHVTPLRINDDVPTEAEV